ncbi:MAG: hypothetical protein JWO50_121 [Candidatus Kaiserbacteria bacterium]|nr:hypothetical protein [Candidatus Kaiserbacteria bacterium]
MKQSLFSDWELPKIIILLLSCFALGALGFFIVTIVIFPSSLRPQAPSEITVHPVMTEQKKAETLLALKPTALEQASTTNFFTNRPTSTRVVNPLQADSADDNAAKKLDILKALDSQ